MILERGRELRESQKRVEVALPSRRFSRESPGL